MRVRMRTRLAGPSGTAEPGRVIDLPDALAKALVAGGSAELVEPSASAQAGERQEDVETAEAPASAEWAVTRRKRRAR